MSSTAQTHAQLLGERRPRDRVGLGHRRRNQQRDRGQEQQARLHAGADAVVFLDVILEPAEEKRRAQHEQRVGDDRAGNGRLHQHVLPGAQGGERDDQFRQIPQRGIEQATDRIAGLGRHRLGGVTEQGRQRHDGQDGQHEQQRVRCRAASFCGREHHGHEDQQPKQLVALNLLEQQFHGRSCSEVDLTPRNLLTAAKKKPVDRPHIRMPVNPSSGPSSRHSFGRTTSP